MSIRARPLFALALTLLPLRVYAQSLAADNTHTITGGFAAFDATFGHVAGQTAVFPGFDASLVVRHVLTIGIAGYGLASHGIALTRGGITGDTLRFGYGGVRVGIAYPVMDGPSLPLFATAELLVGGGRAWSVANGSDTDKEDEGVVVLEPSVGVEAAITRHLRLGVGTTYRYIDSVHLDGLSSTDLRGLTFRLLMRVGSF